MRLKMQRVANIQRTWLLMGVFFLLVMGLGWLMSGYMGNPIILYIAVGLAVLMNLVSFFFSDKIALKISGAREISYKEYPELYTSVKNLSSQARLPMPKLYIIKDSVPNAFATGRNPKRSAIAVTEGLLNILDKNELDGVIAHEIAHIDNRDILVMTVAVVLAGSLSMFADMFWRMSLFGGGSGNDRGGAIAMIVGVVVMIAVPLAGALMQMAISRRREFLADASGALLTHNPEGLASALIKISGYGKQMKKASYATAHLFISDPFAVSTRKKRRRLFNVAKYFSTHPPVEERVAALRGGRVVS